MTRSMTTHGIKTVLYMAVTANGYVAKDDDDVGFVSRSSWDSFDALSREAGNLIMGRRTCEVSVKDGTFPYPGRLNIVVTTRTVKHDYGDTVLFVKTPQAALRELQRRGHKTAFVAGGGALNASFLKTGLIDELYLDIEPVVLGRGIKLFADAQLEAKLRLLGTKLLAKNEVQLHYKVLR